MGASILCLMVYPTVSRIPKTSASQRTKPRTRINGFSKEVRLDHAKYTPTTRGTQYFSAETLTQQCHWISPQTLSVSEKSKSRSQEWAKNIQKTSKLPEFTSSTQSPQARLAWSQSRALQSRWVGSESRWFWAHLEAADDLDSQGQQFLAFQFI